MHTPTLTPFSQESSALDAAHYDAATQTLHVRFVNSGNTYRYKGVPAFKHESLRSAASAGQYFACHIRPHHKGEKV